MICAAALIFAATVNPAFSDLIENDEMAMAESAVSVDPDDAVEDGELIFDDIESVAELE